MRPLTFLASRFVAGENIDEALASVRELNENGIKATLDNLGEDSLTREQANAAAEQNLLMLRRIAETGVDANISLKLTQIGLAIDEALARENLTRIADEAARLKNFVRIDMEGSQWTQKTLDLFYSLHAKYPNLGIVLQAYLRRTQDDCRRAVAEKVRVRLCKGAYKEPADIAFPAKEEVNANYDACAAILAKAPIPAYATHDDARIEAAVKACEAAGTAKKDYEIQMLYGLRKKRWAELKEQGHVFRVYVPYGTHWFPYFYRRLRERKENIFFIARNFFQ